MRLKSRKIARHNKTFKIIEQQLSDAKMSHETLMEHFLQQKKDYVLQHDIIKQAVEAKITDIGDVLSGARKPNSSPLIDIIVKKDGDTVIYPDFV